jgi:[glutamine synthetase] adenylyltransferase / [glutamine synthetase]-adenylyl-L-tyrosine phosphorylase
MHDNEAFTARFIEAGGTVPAGGPAASILEDIFSASPFLSEVLINNPEWSDWLIEEALAEGTKPREDYLRAAREGVDAAAKEEERVRALHRFHRRETLRIGARDLTCRLEVRQITNEISWLADAIVQIAFEQAWRELSARFENSDCRFAVIGVGKLGGEELNFSSDIDLLYVFSGEEHTEFSTKLARRITQILTEHTGDGALYRVDLRLRPEGSRGAIASPLRSLQTYYDSWGETFERMALTKARVIAGHADVGERFMKLIEPFVYRKYLDFAAIDEIHDIKVRIDQQVERSIGLERHVKLGRGGIREIEFFVQALQVLYGGEIEDIRVRSTLTALSRLEGAHLIERAVARRLRDAYVFLRNLEHKLQIVHQLQTHELPADPAELDKVAARMKMSPETFRLELRIHRDAVHATFRDLFAARKGAEEGTASSVHRFINRNMDDGQAREWLRSKGFEDPNRSVHILSVLRDAPAFGHSPTRMKNLLENVLSPVIENASRLVRPNQVLIGLERLMESVGAREAFFTSLLENPRSIGRVTRVLGLSDYLSEILFASPEVLDFLIDDERFERPLRRPAETDDRKTQEFYAGLQYLFGILPRRRASRVLARFADREIRRYVPADANVAVFALGKLGERDLNVRSDLDVIAVYEGEHAPALEIVENLIARLSVHFKLDWRLRPDGKKGSLIFNPERYREYLAERAETWERMALTKTRFVAGDAALGARVQTLIDEFVYGRPFGAAEIEEMKAIRYRMEFEIGRESEDAFDVKVGRGGLVDIEFLAEIEQIRKNIRIPNTIAVLKRLRRSDLLIDDYEFLRDTEFMLRLWSSTASSRFPLSDARALGSMLGIRNFFAEYQRVTEEVRKSWEKLGSPEGDLPPHD